MLAQHFRTADQLMLDECQRTALIKTLGLLERNELPGPFHMSYSGRFPNECGDETNQDDCDTPACIMGWAERFAGDSIFLGSSSHPLLRGLFYPEGSGIQCQNPALAAIALRNFLTTGTYRPWAGVTP